MSADEAKSVSVMEGDSVPLRPDPTYIQGYDVIRWRFGQQKSLVAEINIRAGIFNTYDGPDERFRDRLKLNNQTGSLTITNTTTTDAGLYEVEISSTRRRYTTHHTQSFSVTVSGESINEILNIFRLFFVNSLDKFICTELRLKIYVCVTVSVFFYSQNLKALYSRGVHN